MWRLMKKQWNEKIRFLRLFIQQLCFHSFSNFLNLNFSVVNPPYDEKYTTRVNQIQLTRSYADESFQNKTPSDSK